MKNRTEKIFTKYQIFIIAILSFIQFTVVLDFMILSPLGVMVMKDFSISTKQFGLVVSAYAFSAGFASIMVAGFADKFDRKKFLLFFYSGFVIGTLFCGVSSKYEFLLGARIFTGLFGGVIASICFSMIADLFLVEVRGRVIGFVMSAFAASQVLGIPFGLFLANHLGWKIPFLLIAFVSILVGIIILIYLQPVDKHLLQQNNTNAFVHLFKTIIKTKYLISFSATIFLSTGGFMLMPFASAFSVHNLGLTLEELPIVYLATGTASVIMGPIIGKLTDRIGKYIIFFIGSILSISIILFYTRLGITPLWMVMIINVILFISISARMISSQAIISILPSMNDRGAFMSVNSAIQQVSGGIATMIAGLIVVQTPSGILNGYPTLGYIVSFAMITSIVLMYFINKMINVKIENYHKE